MITRKSLADEIDILDTSIADLNGSKKDAFDAYRDQMIAAGVAKENVRKEIDAVKAAIRRRRAVKKDELAVEEKDALVDEVFAEITAASRAPRATHVREGNGDASYAKLRSEDLHALALEQRRAPIDWDEVSRREFPSDSAVHVYFVEAPALGLIKIGSSANVEHRISALIRNGPAELIRIGVISGGPRLELDLHERFAQHRVRGEWFSSDIRTEVDALLLAEKPGFPDPLPPTVDGGRPKQSSDDGGAKVDGGTSVDGRAVEQTGAFIAQSEQQPEDQSQDRNEPVSEAASSATPFEPPAFLVKASGSMQDTRPHCRNPSACGSYRPGHCYTCSKAAGLNEAAA